MSNDAKTCDTCGAPATQNVHGEIWHIRADQIQIAMQYDHAQAELQAAVAAEREACAEVCDEYSKDHGRGMFDINSNECANRIRARTDTDAQTALEAVKREARNEGLREAEQLCLAAKDKRNKQRNDYPDESRDVQQRWIAGALQSQYNADEIRALMEDTDDDSDV